MGSRFAVILTENYDERLLHCWFPSWTQQHHFVTAAVNRWVNIVFGAVYTVIMILAIRGGWHFYVSSIRLLCPNWRHCWVGQAEVCSFHPYRL